MSAKSILIGDEDRNLRHSLALILKRAGYIVETAGSASETLKYLKTGAFDLVIFDMMMPDEGASMLLPRLLKLYPHLCFIILTAQSSPEIEAETIHKGEHSRLVKPVTPETLLERVKISLHESDAGNGPLLKNKLYA